MDDDTRSGEYALALAQLRRWARGRLPRDPDRTDHLVRETFVEVLRGLEGAEPIDRGTLNVRLRRALTVRISDEVLRVRGRATADDPKPEVFPDVDSVQRRSFEEALQRLSQEEREIILARVERSLDYQDIAEAMRLPSADAVRVALKSALTRLVEEMRGGGDPQPR